MTAVLLLVSNCSSMGVRHRSKRSWSWASHRDAHATFHTERLADKRGLLDPKECSYDEREEKKEGAKRSEEHTSELQSLTNLVCRLLLEKKKKRKKEK